MNLNFETDGVNFNSKGKVDEIATPIHICRDMSNLFDYTNCNQKIWMDIFCKTGNTLEALKEHNVNKENIIAICDNKQSQMLACRKLYGELLPEIEVEIIVKSLEAYKITRRGQVYWVSNWQDTVKNNYQDAYNIIKFVILKEMEKTMSLEFTSQDDFQINNIIMNPPYNNDMYIDFVTLAKNIASNSVVAITPAKWQAKGGQKNEDFRKNIVPYMSKIVYYPDAGDIFDIREMDGITYYVIGNNKHASKVIENKCGRNCNFNNVTNRSLFDYDTLNNVGQSINKKLFTYKKYKFQNGNYQKYMVTLIDAMNFPGKRIIDTQGKTLMFPPINVSTVLVGNESCVFSSDNEDECISFISWVERKMIKFLVLINTIGYNGLFDDLHFKYVPAPEAFDHIFTDEELYQKYGLTDEEIAIIESVIKERK